MDNQVKLCAVCHVHPVVAKGLCSSHYQQDRKEKLRRPEADSAIPSEEEAAQSAAPKIEHDPLPLPFPGFEELPKENDDARGFRKYTANAATKVLNENPDHPNRDKLLKMIREDILVAEMDDETFQAHRLYQANPVNQLTQDEKLHCIRALPIQIVKKLFPYV